MKLVQLPIFCTCIFLLLAHASSCDSGKKNDTRLTISNNANHSIAVMASYSYPDTINYILGECRAYNDAFIYGSGESRFYELWGTTWDVFLDRFESRTVMLFIYNVDTARHYFDMTGDCSMLVGKELKRVDVTMDYLNQNNFTITYP